MASHGPAPIEVPTPSDPKPDVVAPEAPQPVDPGPVPTAPEVPAGPDLPEEPDFDPFDDGNFPV